MSSDAAPEIAPARARVRPHRDAPRASRAIETREKQSRRRTHRARVRRVDAHTSRTRACPARATSLRGHRAREIFSRARRAYSAIRERRVRGFRAREAPRVRGGGFLFCARAGGGRDR